MAIHSTPWYRKILGNDKQQQVYIQYSSVGLGIAIVVVGLFFGYRWYVAYRERETQALLSDYIHMLHNDKNVSLAEMETLFKDAAQKQSGSYLEPYFFLFQANVLIKENKLDQAINIMEKAIAHSSKDNMLLPLLQIKLALMQIDSSVQIQNETGLKTLIDLAKNGKNPYEDMALFYLGHYYWSNNNIEEAKNVWQELIEMQQKNQTIVSSPWAQLAYTKLQQITG